MNTILQCTDFIRSRIRFGLNNKYVELQFLSDKSVRFVGIANETVYTSCVCVCVLVYDSKYGDYDRQ